MTYAADLLTRDKAKPAGEDLQRLRKLAEDADERNGTDITNLSHEDRLRLAMRR